MKPFLALLSSILLCSCADMYVTKTDIAGDEAIMPLQARLGALNPQALVPMLLDDRETITQSMAIIEYLDEKFPDPPLLPPTPEARARVRSIAQVIACDREVHFDRERLNVNGSGMGLVYKSLVPVTLLIASITSSAASRLGQNDSRPAGA